jgi:hypothetical protein
MSGRKEVRVTQESSSGRNGRFYDPTAHRSMSRTEFADRIEDGQYTGYHVREVNRLRTPTSNPDRSEYNNLG